VTYFDVGQGNAALLELPKGYNLLIDGGGFSDNAVFDTGAMIIAPLLWRKKIKTIDTIVLTHPNSDHLNGLIYIAEHFNVRRAVTNNERSSTKGYRNFVEMLEKNHIREPRFPTLEKEFTINGVVFEILYPEDDFLAKTRKDVWRNKNNNSLVLKVAYGRHAFLFPGDIMSMAEKDLAASKCKLLQSSILLAPHHGSASSSTENLLACVEPEVVVVSAGWKNRFNFPQEVVMKRYQKMGCRIFRTDIHGALMIISDGKEMTIQATRGSAR
jgi:competence protein ComEC